MKRWSTLLLSAALAAGAWSCGSDPAVPPTLEVDLFGWEAGEGFVSGMPAYPDAQTVRISVLQPADRSVLATETFPIADRNGDLPEIAFGENLRMDVEVLDGFGEVLASGATPVFDFEPNLPRRSFRVQINPVEAFAPVGSVVVDRETGLRKFTQTRFDYRGTRENWLGRVGHATAVTSEGKILIVGGGDMAPGSSPGAVPRFRNVYGDIQVFEPETGYFSDLAYDESADVVQSEGKDALFEPVAFHTLTPIGQDRFVVTGGFTLRGDAVRPSNTIQLIDLNAEAGMRVQRVTDELGDPQFLQRARGWHSATYRKSDQHLIVAGGVGPGGDDDIESTFELIDLANGRVYSETFDLQEARARHQAVFMPESNAVWLIGGRGAEGALKSSEVLELSDSGTTVSRAEANLKEARFGHAAVRISPGGGNLVLVVGGFTDLEGAVTGSFEVSKLGRGSFESGSSWTLDTPRGGVTAVELPNTQDVMVFGGRGADGEGVRLAERLVFEDLGASPPYAPQNAGRSVDVREGASTDLMSTGRVLLVGGFGEVDGNEAALDSAEFYNPNDPVGNADVVVVE